MNTELKHRLLDLREEVIAGRTEALKAAKSIYDDAKKTEAETYKKNVVAIKEEYRQVFNARKAELILKSENTENENTEEGEN